jgi:hypothetical protein
MRRVVLILAVLSGLLCAGFVVAYAYAIAMDSFDPSEMEVVSFVELDRNRVRLVGSGLHVQVDTSTQGFTEHIDFRLLGISVDVETGYGGTYCDVCLPYWMLISGTAVLPAVCARRLLIRRHRRRARLCLICGYDLRASNDRCPECGTPIPSHVLAKNTEPR